MKCVALVPVVVAFLLSADPALASDPASASAKQIIYSPLSEMTVWPSYYSRQGTWTVRVAAAGSNSGTVRVRCEGAVLAAGDSVLAVLPNRNNGWNLTWKRTSNGPIRIRSTLRVAGADPDSYDLYVHQMVAEFRHLQGDADTVLIPEFRNVQALAVRNGKRFRCDQEFLVALEGAESDELPRFRRRATVKSQRGIQCSDCHLATATVHCPDCQLANETDVFVVATVGTKGKVTWARPYDEALVHPYNVGQPPVDSIIWSAVERAIRRFRYQAAMSLDGPVSDYVLLTIHVVP